MIKRIGRIGELIHVIGVQCGSVLRALNSLRSERSSKAVAFLTFQPDSRQIPFYEQFAALGYSVFVFVDDNDFVVPKSRSVRYIKLDGERCAARGYRLLNPVISKNKWPPVSAWEKALFFFAAIHRRFDHVWFFEDDVFIPRSEMIIDIDRKYCGSDLLCCSSNRINHDGKPEGWSWWKFIPIDVLPLPWAASMVCAVRLSRSLLDQLDALIVENLAKITETGISSGKHETQTKYLFIEYLFNTVALHRGLKITAVPELSTITFSGAWQPAELDEKHLYHPMKNIGDHNELRALLRKRRQSGVETTVP